jgi:hypothetical protein
MAKITLHGVESARQTYPEVWEEGIEVRGGVLPQLPWMREQDTRATSQPERMEALEIECLLRTRCST